MDISAPRRVLVWASAVFAFAVAGRTHADQPSKPCSSCSCRVTDVGERSLGEFTAKPRQTLTAIALRTPGIGIGRQAPAQLYVGPETMCGRSPFRDIRLYGRLGSWRDDLRQVVALVSRDRVEGDLTVAVAKVHCCVDRRIDDRCRVNCSAMKNDWPKDLARPGAGANDSLCSSQRRSPSAILPTRPSTDETSPIARLNRPLIIPAHVPPP
jgi:hypothetical protein